jgi:hypothetical protein
VGSGPCARDWAVGFGGGEEAHYRRRRRILHASVRLLRASGHLYDMLGWAPVHRMGTLVRIGGDFARDASRLERGNFPLKRGSSFE